MVNNNEELIKIINDAEKLYNFLPANEDFTIRCKDIIDNLKENINKSSIDTKKN